MDRETALRELATAQAVALRLSDAGAGDDAIATALDVPIESVPGIVAIARSKVAGLMEGGVR